MFATARDLSVMRVGILGFRQQDGGVPGSIVAASAIVALPPIARFFLSQRRLVESIETSGFEEFGGRNGRLDCSG